MTPIIAKIQTTDKIDYPQIPLMLITQKGT